MQRALQLLMYLAYSNKIQADVMRLRLLAPCRGLERIDYDYFDDEWSDTELSSSPVFNESLGLVFYFKESTYKEFVHVKSIDEQSLIGNQNPK